MKIALPPVTALPLALLLATLAPVAGAQQAPAQDQQTPPPASSTPNSSPAPPAKPGKPADTPAKPSSPSSDNAFPEDVSRQAQDKAQADEKADRNAASSGSADPEAAGSSSRDKLQGLDLLGDNTSRISNGAGGTVLDPKLAKDDIRVGQLYMGDGNFVGAYERFKEATQVNPNNTEAVFYLAEAARKAGHLDESVENYGLYLSVEPKGAKAKDAKKALKEIQGH